MAAITEDDSYGVCPPWADDDADQAPSKPRFQDEDADLLTSVAVPWCVKYLWPRVGLCFVAGPSGSGKSFWVIRQLYLVALGKDVLGLHSCGCGSIYFAAEGATGARARFQGECKAHEKSGGMVRFIGEAPRLNNEKDVKVFLQRLLAISAEMDKRGHRLGMVVIDTLSASMPGADENSGSDMGIVLDALQTAALELGACIIVVAHHGKNVERGIRGWSGMQANADGVISIEAPSEDGTRVGQIVKVKDGESGGKFAFGLEVIDLGQDEDGDPITTCVVVERSVPVEAKPNRQKGPGAPAEFLMRAFDRLSDTTVELPSIPGVPRGTKGVRLSDLRSKSFEMGFYAETKPAADGEPVERRRWLDSRKHAFQRALNKLVETRAVRVEQEFVWAI